VQPGSLGIEALLQLLQIALLDSDADGGTGPDEAVFEPIMLGAPLTWRYRGQVTPAHSTITTVMEITEVGRDDVGPYVIGTGSLWCDGLRIYEVTQMGMRMRMRRASAPRETDAYSVEVSRSVYPQLADHVIEDDVVVPVVLAAEWMLRAMRLRHPDATGFVITDLRVLSGIVLDDFDREQPSRLRVVQPNAAASDAVVRLELISDSTARAHYRGDVQVLEADTRDASTASAFGDRLGRFVAEIDDVYAGGVLFHGPSFQVLHEVRRHENGLAARCLTGHRTGWELDGWESDPAVLDGALQLALLWTHERLAKRSLPTTIGALRIALVRASAPVAAGTRWTMTLVERRSTAYMVVCDVVIHSEDDVLAVIEEIATHVLT
jgi:3-hydroxymyristoyl/3-hydroxydecanoyl-(acyl carrier protein) dehydratase